MKRSSRELLETFKPLVDDLAKAIGANCEVILHDLSCPESSVIAVGGNVTGRKLGAPITDLVLRVLRSGNVPRSLLNYRTQLQDGRTLKSSTLFIRDSSEEVIGCLCFNFDITHWMMTKELVFGLCQASDVDEPPQVTQEAFVQDIEDILRDSLRLAIQTVGKPVALMQKEDKVTVVKMLDDGGIFLIKKAASYVARSLSVSRYTIYNYLDEARRCANNGHE